MFLFTTTQTVLSSLIRERRNRYWGFIILHASARETGNSYLPERRVCAAASIPQFPV
jgi:hypothetical protein